MATLAEIRAQYPQYGDMSDTQLADALHSAFYADMPKAEYYQKLGLKTGGGSALARGIDELQGNLYSAAEGAGRLTGIGALQRFGQAGRERNELEAEQSLPRSEMQSFGDAEGVGGYARAGLQALGLSLPSSAGPLAGAAAGAAAGSVVPFIGTGIGALLGGAAAAIPQFYGANRQRQIAETGQVGSELGALATAVPQAAVESVTDRLTLGLGKVLGLGPDLVAKNLLPRIARGIGLGAAAEVPTEVMQQALERAQAGLDVTSPDAMREYREAAIAAGLVGGTLGGASAGAFGPKPQTPNDRDRELETSLGTLRDAARQNLADQQLQLGYAARETPRGTLTARQLIEVAQNSSDPRMQEVLQSEIPHERKLDRIVQLMAEPTQGGTLYQRPGTQDRVMTEEELRADDERQRNAEQSFLLAELKQRRAAAGATQDPRAGAAATLGEQDLREIPVVPGEDGRPVPVAAAGYALVTEQDEEGEEIQVPRPFVVEIDPRTGEPAEGAEPFQYTDGMRKVTRGALYPRPGVSLSQMREFYEASATARAKAKGNQSLSQVTNQARATDRVGTNADVPGPDGTPPYGTQGRPPRYQPPETEEKPPRAPRTSLDSAFAEAAAFQGENIPAAEDFTADRAFFGGPAAAQAKPPAARPKPKAPPAPPAQDLFTAPQPPAPVAPPAAPQPAAETAPSPTPMPAAPASERTAEQNTAPVADDPAPIQATPEQRAEAEGWLQNARRSIRDLEEQIHDGKGTDFTRAELGRRRELEAKLAAKLGVPSEPTQFDPARRPNDPLSGISDEERGHRDQLRQIADGWEAAGNAGMAKMLRTRADGKMAVNQGVVDFNREKLAESQRQAANTEAPRESYSLDEFYNQDRTDKEVLQRFKQTASPEAKQLYRDIEAAMQAAVAEINRNGFTRRKSGTEAGNTPRHIEKIRDELAIAGTLRRFMNGEIALRKGYKRGDPDRVARETAELRKELQDLRDAIQASQAANPPGTSPVQTPNTPAPQAETAKPAAETAKPGPETGKPAIPPELLAYDKDTASRPKDPARLVAPGKPVFDTGGGATFDRIAGNTASAEGIVFVPLAPTVFRVQQVHPSGKVTSVLGYVGRVSNAQEAADFFWRKVNANRAKDVGTVPGTPGADVAAKPAAETGKPGDQGMDPAKWSGGEIDDALRNGVYYSGDPVAFRRSLEAYWSKQAKGFKAAGVNDLATVYQALANQMAQGQPYNPRAAEEAGFGPAPEAKPANQAKPEDGAAKPAAETDKPPGLRALTTEEWEAADRAVADARRVREEAKGPFSKGVGKKNFRRGFMAGAEGEPRPDSAAGREGYEYGLRWRAENIQDAPAAAKPTAETGKPRRSTTIQTVSGMKVKADYELVDLDQLQAAKGATQPRDRSRAASEGQIAELFRTFDPAQVIEGAGASVGTPIVGPDGTVESGNGRIAAMRRLREEAPERWAAYQQALRDAGYEPGENQVLVRRRTSELSPEELRQFVTDANSSPTLGMSGTERGMVDRDLVDQGLLSQLDTDADLFAASNDRFVRGFIGKLPANERATMLDTDGRLSQDGARRIEGAILARAYGDPALLQRIVEDRDDDTRSVSKALLSAAPAWIGLQDAVKRGEVKPEFDATPRLLDAVRMLRDMRARKLKANDFLAQQDVFNQPDPLATAFFRTFFNEGLTRAAGAEKISKVLERYVGEAEQRTPNPLFPDDTTPLQALEAARKDPQGGLFSSRVQPTPGTVSDDVAKARKVVADRLAELRAMGRQGVKAAEAVEKAMRGPFSPQQVVAAFRIGETAARILGDRSLVIRFMPDIIKGGIERQGELVHVSPEGTNGLVHFSLSKSSLAFARQTGAHEAFHVAQTLFAASDPKLWAELKAAFPEGKGLQGIDATLKRKLQTLRAPDGRSYWDQLINDKGIQDTAVTSIEAQAYVFGALDEARRHGQSMVGIKPVFLRFLNFLAELRQRLASVLRGDGFRSVGDTLEAVSAGTGLRGLTKAADMGGAFSSRLPTASNGDTLKDITFGFREKRPDGGMVYTVQAAFGGGGTLNVYATVSPDGTLDVQDIYPQGVENNPHRYSPNGEVYEAGVRVGPAETRKLLRALSNAAKEDGVPVRAVSGTRETGARVTSGRQDLAYNLGSARFSSRRPADLAGDPAIQAAYDATKGKGIARPGWFDRTMAKITGAVPGEDYRQALYRNAVNRAAPLYILDEMKRTQGVPDSRSLGRMADRAFNNAGRLEMVLEHGFIGYDPKTDRTFVRDDVPSVLQAFVGPDRKNPRVRDSERDDFQNYLALLRERDLLKAGRSGFKNLNVRQVLDGIAAIEGRRAAWKDAAADIHKINRAALDFGVATGILEKGKADELASMFYTPFYRLAEAEALSENQEGGIVGPAISNSLNNPRAFEKRVHESESQLGDLFENMVRNYDFILRSGEKNVVLKAAAEGMEKVTNAAGEKLAERIPYRGNGDRQVITLKDGGQPVYYRLNPKDPTAAATFLALVGVPSPVRNAMFQGAARLAGIFRTGVTSLPSYMMANLWRGKVVAYAQEGLPLYTNSIDGMRQVYKAASSKTLKDFAAETGFGGFTFGMGEKNVTGTLARKLRTEGGDASLWDRWGNLVDFLQRASEATELADRIKLQERLVSQGKSVGEAAHQAYLLAPYSRKGLGQGLVGSTLMTLVPLVPFLNSKVQGVARMFEGDAGTKGKRRIAGVPQDIFLRGLVLTAFSTAAYALASDDDRWKDETPDRKLMYDIFYVGDKTIYLPKPFEFGTFFGSLPVFALDAAFGGEQGRRDLKQGVVQALLGTFGFNPIPQAVQPLLETAVNYDFFRGRPLESQGMEQLPVGERATEQTSTVAKVVSRGITAVDEAVLPEGSRLGLSPIKVQRLIEGYTGSIGTMLLAASDALLGAAGVIPARPGGVFGSPSSPVGAAATVAGVGRFIRADEDKVSRFVGDFYTMKRQADQLHKAFTEALLVGDQDKAQGIVEGNRPILAVRPALEGVERQLATINKAMRSIAEREDMPLDERRTRLAELRQMRNDLSRRAVEAARGVQ